MIFIRLCLCWTHSKFPRSKSAAQNLSLSVIHTRSLSRVLFLQLGCVLYNFRCWSVYGRYENELIKCTIVFTKVSSIDSRSEHHLTSLTPPNGQTTSTGPSWWRWQPLASTPRGLLVKVYSYIFATRVTIFSHTRFETHLRIKTPPGWSNRFLFSETALKSSVWENKNRFGVCIWSTRGNLTFKYSCTVQHNVYPRGTV